MKWFIGILVIVAIAAGVAWKMGLIKMAPAAPVAEQIATTTQQQPAQQQVQSGLPTQQSDTSDAAVAQDSAAVDAELSGMSQDSAAVDSSMQDKPTTQSF